MFTMVGPGGDPHTYQPSTKDIEKMQDADLVLWNGLHLEALMITQLESLGDKQLAVGDQLDTADLLTWPEEGAGGAQLYDPHIWNSPELWSQVVDLIGDKLADVDADNAETFPPMPILTVKRLMRQRSSQMRFLLMYPPEH